jgi:beta-glucosidase
LAYLSVEHFQLHCKTFPLDARSFSYYDVAAKKWTIGSSKFTISVGDSVESLPLQGALSLRGTEN